MGDHKQTVTESKPNGETKAGHKREENLQAP